MSAHEKSAAVARRQLLGAYRRIRAQTLSLIDGLSAEDCMVQSMTEASPVKWHLAHVTWFFETLVLEQWLPRLGMAFRPFRPEFRVLFNSYYVGVGAFHPRPERGVLSRPSLDEVLTYRDAVDEQMIGLMLLTDLSEELLTLVELGLHHEQQHQELILTDLKHHFSRNPLLPAYRKQVVKPQIWKASRTELEFVAFAGGQTEIGHADSGFAFDNERPRHGIWLEPFAMASRLVTNGEYLRFMDDGGYQHPELWLSDGWDLITRKRWGAPLYWMPDGNGWSIFTLGGIRHLDLDEPVCHVSYYEAEAYARWANARIPFEGEWEHAAQMSLIASAESSRIRRNFLENGVLHPVAAGVMSDGLSEDREVTQLFGDVWEWMQSAYLPYPGYKSPVGPVGEYNGKFMVNQMVLRGGSCATPNGHIRSSYRNFFHPHARWQFSGIRLVRDIR